MEKNSDDIINELKGRITYLESINEDKEDIIDSLKELIKSILKLWLDIKE